MSAAQSRPSVAIVGGGLAGLAVAVRLAEHGVAVELFEARRQLGGRATSFRDPVTGTVVDHCQHVALGCCTNFIDFCERTGQTQFLTPHRTLHFFGPDGSRSDLTASRFLPAPLHLLPSLLRLKYLSGQEKIGIVRAMRQLAYDPCSDDVNAPTIEAWLREHGQSDRVIDLFWAPIIVSGLSETLDRAAVPPVRKLFVEAFISSRRAYEMLVPRIPLGDFYCHLESWLHKRGVAVKLGCPVIQVCDADAGTFRVDTDNGGTGTHDLCILATEWRRLTDVLSESIRAKLPELQAVAEIESAPITAVHLWFDRPITDLPHAVLPGRMSQWMFNRGKQQITSEMNNTTAHYYQIVISASRHLADQSKDEITAQVVGELAAVWPVVLEAKVIQARTVTQQHAVFSVRPGIEMLRPSQKCSIPNLFLAGDWTQTDWPSTMEGAVRSGYLAAEQALEFSGKPTKLLAPDLRRSWLARLLFGA